MKRGTGWMFVLCASCAPVGPKAYGPVLRTATISVAEADLTEEERSALKLLSSVKDVEEVSAACTAKMDSLGRDIDRPGKVKSIVGGICGGIASIGTAAGVGTGVASTSKDTAGVVTENDSQRMASIGLGVASATVSAVGAVVVAAYSSDTKYLSDKKNDIKNTLQRWTEDCDYISTERKNIRLCAGYLGELRINCGISSKPAPKVRRFDPPPSGYLPQPTNP